MNRLKLDDVEWKEFKIGYIFEIAKVLGKPLDNYNVGTIPYISTSANNNAVVNFVEQKNENMSNKNTISIDPIGGKAFYHEYDFVGRGFSGASVNLLYHKKFNKNICLFVLTCIEKSSMAKASYGNLFNSKRLYEGKFLLPVDLNGQTNWKFMESYSKELENRKKQEYLNYVNSIVSKLKYKEILPLNKKEWVPFFIKDIFITKNNSKKQVPTGAHVDKNFLKVGVVPRISVTSLNNGIDSFCDSSDKNYKVFENFITTSFLGTVFYHKYSASLDMKVHCLQLKNKILNTYLSQFIIYVIKSNISSASYGNQISSTDLPNKRILLPVNSAGEPDYEYMEQYSKNLMLKKYEDYLKYIKR